MINDKEAHDILDHIMQEGKQKKLYGQTSFIIHWQDGKIKQFTDVTTRRTWRAHDAGQ